MGTLHVRPILDMRRTGPNGGAQKMRAIAAEASALVRQFKGAYSGEHGDGLVRSEWVAWQFGPRLTRAFEQIKELFDPDGVLNPGKIVRPARMDDASLFRYPPGYSMRPLATALDWSAWDVNNDDRGDGGGDHRFERISVPGTGGDPAAGFGKAAEMCNNNGHCRKLDAGTMCPSFRATRDEQHLTRGRANTLRLALSGQLGPDALISDEMFATMDLCVSCKGCKRDCPTGVDMARMKIEFLHHYRQRRGLGLKERLIAYLPRYAPWAARWPALANARDAWPALARMSERMTGLSAQRRWPRWRADTFFRNAADRSNEQHANASRVRAEAPTRASSDIEDQDLGAGLDAVLFVDTFSNYFEPEIAHAALRVLNAAGLRVRPARPARDDAEPNRPLCCGRTFLAVGLVDEARREAQRMIDALAPLAERGVPIVGLEPSCVLGLRDEYQVLRLGERARVLGEQTFLFEEFLVRAERTGRLSLPLRPIGTFSALLHGHCHQKAFDALAPTRQVLSWIPGLSVQAIESSCCGMAGSFGYEAAHHDVSLKMAELSLLPALRAAATDTIFVADGTSCRTQIAYGLGGTDVGQAGVSKRRALHAAEVLASALAP